MKRRRRQNPPSGWHTAGGVVVGALLAGGVGYYATVKAAGGPISKPGIAAGDLVCAGALLGLGYFAGGKEKGTFARGLMYASVFPILDGAGVIALSPAPSRIGKNVTIPFSAIKGVENTGLSTAPPSAPVVVTVTADDGTTATGVVVSIAGFAQAAGVSTVVQFLDSAILATT